MNSALPPDHPDDDLLADLAADVLPTHQARAVEAHVMVCARCTALLTDAEQVRNLLLTDDPGPMPADVLARIDQLLQVEVTARVGAADYPPQSTAGSAPDHAMPTTEPRVTPAVRVISPWEDTTTIEAFQAERKRQVAASRRPSRDAAAPTLGEGAPAAPTSPRSRGPRLTRPSRGPSQSRRDMREEVRDVKAGRRGTVLAAAASVVVLLGLGGYVVVALLGNREAGTATTAASSVEAAGKAPAADSGGGPPVLNTGTNYTQATLAQKAKSLVSAAAQAPGQLAARSAGAGGTFAATGSDAAAPTAAAGGNESLRNAATLNGCLSALRAGGRRPVAVDLAKFDGRDAAIIVLNGSNGGYEVWAVDRDCRPGDDGTITYLDLTH